MSKLQQLIIKLVVISLTHIKRLPQVCRCDLGTENTTINELQVLCHSLSGHDIRNNCFIYRESISIRELRPGGAYYLSTCAKLYLEMVQNYIIICNHD
jgi:hypothetical protein